MGNTGRVGEIIRDLEAWEKLVTGPGLIPGPVYAIWLEVLGAGGDQLLEFGETVQTLALTARYAAEECGEQRRLLETEIWKQTWALNIRLPYWFQVGSAPADRPARPGRPA